MVEELRKCKGSCAKEKPLSDFRARLNAKGPLRYEGTCKRCMWIISFLNLIYLILRWKTRILRDAGH